MFGNNFGYGGGGYGNWGMPGNYPQQPMSNTVNNTSFTRYQNNQAVDPNLQKPALQLPWVNGEVGAKAFTIAPNTSVLLMDSENPIFYIKTSDIGGKATIRTYKYEELSPVQAQESDHILRKEFEQFKADFQKWKDDLEKSVKKGEEANL